MFSPLRFVVDGLVIGCRFVGISRRGRLPSLAVGIVVPCTGGDQSAISCCIGTQLSKLIRIRIPGSFRYLDLLSAKRAPLGRGDKRVSRLHVPSCAQGKGIEP